MGLASDINTVLAVGGNNFSMICYAGNAGSGCTLHGWQGHCLNIYARKSVRKKVEQHIVFPVPTYSWYFYVRYLTFNIQGSSVISIHSCSSICFRHKLGVVIQFLATHLKLLQECVPGSWSHWPEELSLLSKLPTLNLGLHIITACRHKLKTESIKWNAFLKTLF